MRADREAEPLRARRSDGLRRRRPDDLRQDLAARRPLHGDVVQLVGRRPSPRRLQAELLGLLAQPDAVVVVAADPAEVVVRRAGTRCRRRSCRRSRCTWPCRRPGRRRAGAMSRVIVALQQRLGVGAEDLELAQRRQVHDRRALAAGPVLGDRRRRCRSGRQPVAAVLGEVRASAPTCAGGRPVSLVSFGLGVGGHAVGDRCARSVFFAG